MLQLKLVLSRAKCILRGVEVALCCYAALDQVRFAVGTSLLLPLPVLPLPVLRLPLLKAAAVKALEQPQPRLYR